MENISYNRLKENGFVEVRDNELSNIGEHYINKQGDVIRVLLKKSGIRELRNVSVSNGNNGYKMSIYIKGKTTTKQIHDLVYKSFRGDYEGNLVYVDGNKLNCSLDNLVSMKELVEVYRNKVS